MRDFCVENDITKLAMPRIGAGLDKLDWEQVKEVIEDVFEDTDIEITVYVL
jgi:O-acetyl-ADP-ribose deacetylase (regulator of RNase III)